ncbi:uncharacterized protein MELLADRAFT_68007 [Melampsora larici-populina 98AG31]|uniref:Uncharacterized protein n=1 Tax=Melampsora larici-populina (strain 98AG31 / pathotype 3-4-7) TaxID=747676 RepID=F4S589_MELLP|nr:uncharacterized protein MELLADRAFT_68007 [Melampsora larici-populina 98AG31]EGG00200.1 hypothetical protein MELLADRAFT_68007 [Melampsora larici-populina 98AG31]
MRSSTNSSSTSKSSHHTLLSIDQQSHHQHSNHHEFNNDHDRTNFKSHPYKPIRDWLRRARRKSSFKLPALITALLTTLAFSIWWIRIPSSTWRRPRFSFGVDHQSSSSIESLTTTTTKSSRNWPLFTLLIAPHPGRPIQINLDIILKSIPSQTAHLQLHSITLICTSPSSCPSTIPSQVQKLTNLNSFYPHPDSKAVLLIESELGLSDLNPDWISNALDLLFLDPQKPRSDQIISATGLIRSHHHHLPTRLECIVGDAQTITRVELPLTPILIKSQPWSRLTDYSEDDWLASSGLPSLRLSLDLFERQLPSFVMPTMDSSAIWKSCERGLGELRASAIGPGLEAQLVQHLDDTLHFEDERRQSDQSGEGRLCVLLEELNQLEEGLGWDSIICNFLERGVSLDVLVMVDRLDERSEVKQRMKFLKCVTDIEIMTRTTSKTRIESESRWHQFFVSRNYSVLIYPKNSMDPIAKYVLEHQLGTDFGQFKDEDEDHQVKRLVAIGLPSGSVKGADWITGLELHALRSSVFFEIFDSLSSFIHTLIE